MPADQFMQSDQFTQRVARVRARFATALPGKIADSFAALHQLSNAAPDGIDTVIAAHRRLHEICGIAPTLGFSETGKAARGACTAIGQAAKLKRAATASEIDALKAELDRLRTAAEGELQDLAPGDRHVE
jgi:hypothetical protein